MLTGTRIQFTTPVNPGLLLQQLKEQLGVQGRSGPTDMTVLEAPANVTLEQVQAVIAAHDATQAEERMPSLSDQLEVLWSLVTPPPGSPAARMKDKVLRMLGRPRD